MNGTLYCYRTYHVRMEHGSEANFLRLPPVVNTLLSLFVAAGSWVRSAEETGYDSAAQLYYLTFVVGKHFHSSGFSDRSDIDMYQRSDNPTPSDMYQLESPSPSQPPRNRSSPSFYEELTREEDTRHEVTSSLNIWFTPNS